MPEEAGIEDILRDLPHRYPMLLVDRVLECEAGRRLVAIKNVTINEPFFPGHFPGHPVMPGVLILEALAQATGLLAFRSGGEGGGRAYYLVGIDRARFKRPVVPGDQLRLEVELKRLIRGVGIFDCVARVDGEVCAEAQIMCTTRDGTA